MLTFSFKRWLTGLLIFMAFGLIKGVIAVTQKGMEKREAEAAAQAKAKEPVVGVVLASDPEAIHYIESLSGNHPIATFTLKRVGPAAGKPGTEIIRYGRFEFDCINETGRYLGVAPTLQGLENLEPESRLYPQVQGSPEWEIMTIACDGIGWSGPNNTWRGGTKKKL